MGLFADIQDSARREARQARMQAEQTEAAVPSTIPQQDALSQEIQPSAKENLSQKPLTGQTTTEQPVATPQLEQPAPVEKAEQEEPKQAAPVQPEPTPMSDNDVMAASAKRIRTEIERITRRNMKDCVATYLADLCAKDPAFARQVIQPKKSMVNCFRYITKKAEAYAKQEREDNGVTETGVYGCDVPDDIVYQWAVDYFNDPDADKEPVKKTPVQKPSAAVSKTKRTPATPPTPAQPKTQPTPVSAAFEQMSLLG